jgi:hypothetical protein
VNASACGYGARPLTTLLEQLERGRPRESYPGMWIRDWSAGGGWTDPIPGADPEPDIVALPAWDYDVFGDMKTILRTGVNTFGPHVDGYLPTRAGRGCPFTCAYCSAPRWGKLQNFAAKDKRNTRPVAHLCDELASLRDRYEPEGFEFWDEHFPISVEWLRELAREYPLAVQSGDAPQRGHPRAPGALGAGRLRAVSLRRRVGRRAVPPRRAQPQEHRRAPAAAVR